MGSKALPPYVIKPSSSYYFRINIPADLRPLVGLSELRYSLRTGYLSEAKTRAALFASYTLQLFRSLRDSRMDELTDAQVRPVTQLGGMIKENLSELLGKEQRKRFMWLKVRWSDTEHNAGTMIPILLALLKGYGKDLSPDSDLYRKVCYEYASASGKCLDAILRREDSDFHKANGQTKFFDKPKAPQEQTLEYTPDERDTKTSPKSLPELVRLYVEDQKTEGKWRPKTEDEFRACLNLLQEYFGDMPVDSITFENMREYREILKRFPKNRLKGKYKGKSIAEILEIKILPEDTMSTSSVNKYLSRTSSLFNYAVKRDFMRKNPAVGMEIKQEKRDHELRDCFTPDDLGKLFGSEEYREDKHRSSYRFWLPILALYTGCRLDELCQLHLDDIQQVGGVWVLDINDKEEKKVKSKAGKRRVPLHPFLIEDLKFIAYVESLQAKGHKRLFPELALRRDGYGQTASKWFQRYRARCGIIEGGKVFHSFRHTFDNALKQNRVDGNMISELMGHAMDSLAMSRYADPYRPKVLLEDAILKLDFGVDLSHLPSSKFVASKQ